MYCEKKIYFLSLCHHFASKSVIISERSGLKNSFHPSCKLYLPIQQLTGRDGEGYRKVPPKHMKPNCVVQTAVGASQGSVIPSKENAFSFLRLIWAHSWLVSLWIRLCMLISFPQRWFCSLGCGVMRPFNNSMNALLLCHSGLQAFYSNINQVTSIRKRFLRHMIISATVYSVVHKHWFTLRRV